MNNYEYIIAGLPVLNRDMEKSELGDPDSIIEEIRSRCPSRDLPTVDFLLKGCDSANLNEEFYSSALSSRNRFIRAYFSYDLMMRNRKAAFINRSLGRPEGQDMLPEEEGDITRRDAVDAALATEDLLSREKALDSLLWDRIEELTALEVLNLEVVLGFIARLKIVGRWVQLDPATGREFFRKLVETVRGSYKKQENN